MSCCSSVHVMVLHVSEFIFLLFQTSRMNYLQSIFRSSSIHIGAVFCRMCPVFQVSNVTGENLDLLKMFLNLLSTRVKCDISKPAEFQIDDTFSVPVSLKLTLVRMKYCFYLNIFLHHWMLIQTRKLKIMQVVIVHIMETDSSLSNPYVGLCMTLTN